MTGAMIVAFACAVGSAVGAGPTIRRVSVGPGGAQSVGSSSEPMIDPTGRFVVFHSNGGDLVGGDANVDDDVFVWSRQTGVVTRRSFGLDGNEPNGGCLVPSVSAGAEVVAFHASASNLVQNDTNGVLDVFLSITGGGTSRASVGSGGQSDGVSSRPMVDAQGLRVAFNSSATNLVPDGGTGTLNCYVRDVSLGTTVRASEALGGGPANGVCFEATIDPTGAWAGFDSLATNLVAGDTNARKDIFVRDLAAGVTERVSVSTGGAQGNAESNLPSLSSGAAFVAFTSFATNLVAGDTNFVSDIFVRDRAAGTTTRVSVATGGGQSNGFSARARISPDGRWVVFQSDASNLVAGDTNGWQDVFLHDRQTGVTRLISVSASGTGGNSSSNLASVSADGRFVAFASAASNLVPGDTNGQNDIFLVDLDPRIGDLNGDDVVNSLDLSAMLGGWGPMPGPGDLDGDGDVDSTDLSTLLGAWGSQQ